jgi:hypothetical protein
MSNRSVIPAPYSTAGIKDAETRAVLDNLINILDARSGSIDKESSERFITAQEFSSLATQAVVDAFAGGVTGGTAGSLAAGAKSSGGATAASAIKNLSDSIQKTILYQLLNTQIDGIDIGALRGNINAVIQRLGTAEAATSSEVTRRVTETTALASAINNMWASIGGTAAVIQDGTLAAATASTASATKWNTVIASVTDPSTGLVNSTSIKQDLNSYASNVDGKFNALYTVRAQVAYGGSTVVGGFGLSATAGASSGVGPTINFGVLANQFFIAAPSSGNNPVADFTTQNNFPFIVVTTPTTINGLTYAPGVYMKSVAIGDGSIDNAKIGRHLSSDTFNGTFDFNGNIASLGSAGWAIDKSGIAVFNSVTARGNIQATSLTANTVYTDNIVGGAVSNAYIGSNTTGGTTCATGSIPISSDAQALVITFDQGYSYSSGAGKDSPGGMVINTGYWTIQQIGPFVGSEVAFHTRGYVIAPALTGTYVLRGYRTIAGPPTTNMHLTATLIKR